MYGWFPGWPGPLAANGRIGGIGGVALPAMPTLPGGGALAAAPPLAGLASRGVPVGHTPGGQAMLRTDAGGGATAFLMPPEIPGMPGMPKPPDSMLLGGPQGGGLFLPMAPLAPFDPSNQVRQLQLGQVPAALQQQSRPDLADDREADWPKDQAE